MVESTRSAASQGGEQHGLEHGIQRLGLDGIADGVDAFAVVRLEKAGANAEGVGEIIGLARQGVEFLDERLCLGGVLLDIGDNIRGGQGAGVGGVVAGAHPEALLFEGMAHATGAGEGVEYVFNLWQAGDDGENVWDEFAL